MVSVCKSRELDFLTHKSPFQIYKHKHFIVVELNFAGVLVVLVGQQVNLQCEVDFWCLCECTCEIHICERVSSIRCVLVKMSVTTGRTKRANKREHHDQFKDLFWVVFAHIQNRLPHFDIFIVVCGFYLCAYGKNDGKKDLYKWVT